MSLLAEKLRAAVDAEKRTPSDGGSSSSVVETENGAGNHRASMPQQDDKSSQPRISISEKLRAAASMITSPRQEDDPTNHIDAITTENDKLPGRTTMTLAEKLKASAAVEKLKQPNINGDKPDTTTRPRATTKLLAAVAAAKFAGATTPWGSYAFLEKLDIDSLSNEKLRRHLSARGVGTEGGKKELIDRLVESLKIEKQREIALKLELERKHREMADAEELGAVYSVGKNNMGQLGVEDLEDRFKFTVIPFTRGRHCQSVSTSTGANMTLATTANHEVFCWGGGGMGPMGLKGKYATGFETPQLVVKLNGEDIVMTSVGANHALALSKEGDLFSWGKGEFGVLGYDSKKTETPKYLDFLESRNISTVSALSCGEQHTCIATKKFDVYSWGHASNGRLGIGKVGNDVIFKSSPVQVEFPAGQAIKQIACGSEHTLASTGSTVFSWGVGDGGRLGHGSNQSDRWEPTEIIALRGSHILDVSAGTWHSAAVVNVPPMKGAGYLYTFGSGYQGQLGLDKTCRTSTPTLVKAFCDGQANVARIYCGCSHNAAITSDGNLWTWGSNKHGALGRSIAEGSGSTFTPHPGIVPEFGTIVDRIGRGLPRSVACGREYTIVATYPYDGPSEEEALKILDMHRQRDEAERRRREELQRAKEDELRRLREEEMERKKIRYLTSKRLCTMSADCPGFTYESSQPSICRECGFSVVYHTIVVDEQDD